ncbi:MAG: TraR/DksA C4-type zinc finger protein [Pseudomonadota bacterium]
MDIDDSAVEASELLVDGQRDAQVARIRAALDAPGREDCANCGDEIGAARRRVLPSAVRCVRCQGRYERRGN